MAPKPKVRMAGRVVNPFRWPTAADVFLGRVVCAPREPYFTWECPCGEAYRGHFIMRLEDAVQSAASHSRMHTAERIAEELERREAAAYHAYVYANAALGREIEAAEALGNAEGIQASAHLVRQHLVKEGS